MEGVEVVETVGVVVTVGVVEMTEVVGVDQAVILFVQHALIQFAVAVLPTPVSTRVPVLVMEATSMIMELAHSAIICVRPALALRALNAARVLLTLSKSSRPIPVSVIVKILLGEPITLTMPSARLVTQCVQLVLTALIQDALRVAQTPSK